MRCGQLMSNLDDETEAQLCSVLLHSTAQPHERQPRHLSDDHIVTVVSIRAYSYVFGTMS